MITFICNSFIQAFIHSLIQERRNEPGDPLSGVYLKERRREVRKGKRGGDRKRERERGGEREKKREVHEVYIHGNVT